MCRIDERVLTLHRMVYITGTQEQNAIAKQMVIEKVGGRPFIASTDKEGDMVTVVAELRVPATCCEVQRLMRDLQAEIRDIEVNCGVAIIASPLSRVEIGLPQRDIVVRGGSDESRLLAAEHIRSLLTHLRSEQLPESEESCIKFLIPVSAIETFIGSSHDDVLRTLSLASDVVVSIDMESKSPSISQNARELIVAGSTTVMLQAVRAIIERQQSIGGICRLPVQTTSSPGPPNALIDDFSSIHPAMNMWSVPMYSSLPAVSGQMIHGLWPLPASAEGFYYSPEASIAFQQQLYQNYVNSTFYSNVGSFVSSRSSPPVLHSRVLRAPADPPIAPSISDVRHGRSPPMHLPYYVHAPLQQNRADPTIRCDMIDAKSSKKAQRGIGVDSSKGRSRKQSIGGMQESTFVFNVTTLATYPLTINEPLSLHPASSASQEHAPNSVSPNNSYNAILSSPLELVGAPGGVIVSPRVFPSGAMPPSEPSP